MFLINDNKRSIFRLASLSPSSDLILQNIKWNDCLNANNFHSMCTGAICLITGTSLELLCSSPTRYNGSSSSTHFHRRPLDGVQRGTSPAAPAHRGLFAHSTSFIRQGITCISGINKWFFKPDKPKSLSACQIMDFVALISSSWSNFVYRVVNLWPLGVRLTVTVS